MRQAIRDWYEARLFGVMLWCAQRIGYRVSVYVPPGTGEIRVIHFYDTDEHARESMRAFLDSAYTVWIP